MHKSVPKARNMHILFCKEAVCRVGTKHKAYLTSVGNIVM